MKNFKWNKKYLYWGVTAFCVIVASIVFFLALSRWKSVAGIIRTVLRVLRPFIYGLVIAYVLNNVLTLLERLFLLKLCKKLFPKSASKAKKAARIIGIILTLILALGVLAALLIIMLPQIFWSIKELINKSSDYLEIIIGWIGQHMDGNGVLEPIVVEWLNTFSTHLMGWVETDVLPQMSTLISSITSGVIGAVKVVINLFIGLVVSVYIMYHKEMFKAQGKKILCVSFKPKTVNVIINEAQFVDKAFGDYIVGTLIDAIIIGIANFIFMQIFRMPYAALVSIIVSITNIIPVFGPFIGAIPSTILILLENPMQALIFVIFTIVLQQCDGQILKPLIHSSKTGLSGFWIMFAIIFFGGLFGVVGMLIGVPLITILYSAVRRLNNKRLIEKGLPFDTAAYYDLKKIDPDSLEFNYKSSGKSVTDKRENVQEKENEKAPEESVKK